jgi:hypothetical protein
MSNIKFGLRTRKGLIRPIIESSDYDIDARAYFAANTAITSPLDKKAISDFYGGLKSDGIYTKIKAMYLPIWGSAAACKWNLVNPLDSDAAYRATFTTGITYSSSGILFNGTSSYMDTKFVPSSGFTSINASGFSFYQRTNNTDTSCHGCIPSSTNDRFYFAPQSTYYQIQGTEGATYWNTYANADRKGFYTNSRRANNDRETYKNGASKATNTANDTGGALSSINFYIGAANGPFISSTYSANQISFACLDTGLTDSEASNLSSRVNTLMTYFGINVY